MLVVTPGWGHSERINKHFWLWVPAFARTTIVVIARSGLSVVAQRAKAEATKQSILYFARRDGLLRGACHRAARSLPSGARSRDPLAPTRWLAMTARGRTSCLKTESEIATISPRPLQGRATVELATEAIPPPWPSY